MEKYLIINADDFGYNEQQTAAIKELLSKKLITSTSMLTVTPYSQTAAAMLKDLAHPVGVHLSINSDDSTNRWKSNSKAKSLEDECGLFADQKKVAFVKRKDVAAELEAQYAFITQNGGTVDHADNHCGTLYGINLRRFYIDSFEFCSRHSLPYRFPKLPDFFEKQTGMKLPRPLRAYFAHIANEAVKRNVPLIDDLVSNPWSIERIGNYETLRKYYLDAVDNCVEGVTEMFLHPALPVSDEVSSWTKRVFEYELLKSGDLLERAERNGIKVVPWGVFKEL